MVIAEILRHIVFFATVNVESKVLIDLESVESDYLKLGKSGVDKTLRPDNTLSNHLIRHSLHKSLRTDLVRNFRDVHIHS